MNYSETRIVYKGSIARKLLKLGYKIVDIRPRKQKDGSINYKETVFVFEYADRIDEKIQELINQQGSK